MHVAQIGMIGVIGTILALQFQKGERAYGVYVSIAVSLFLFACIAARLEDFVDTMGRMKRYVSMESSYLSVMLKMLGITYVAEFCGDLCRDAGYGAIAAQIEIFGKLTILALGTPMFLALLETIQEFLT